MIGYAHIAVAEFRTAAVPHPAYERPPMLTIDPRSMKLVALGMAKVTYGALSIMRRHLGNDLDLGLIGFAVVLRTRRDLFRLVERDGLTEATLAEIADETGFYTSVNEISTYTGINRATVRRKMAMLADLDILEKVADDRWHLKDFAHGEAVRPALMLRELLENYLAVTNKLEALLPDEVLPVMRKSLTELGPIEAKALLDDEVEMKLKRQLAVDH